MKTLSFNQMQQVEGGASDKLMCAIGMVSWFGAFCGLCFATGGLGIAAGALLLGVDTVSMAIACDPVLG
ncbi:MAG: bacteriocin [Prevotellaceae bacterium]|jgi:bacteriocin-like protein|nr:bacteriocin [Prevotellaceae bacterium]